jgi:hypothetical protein
MRTQRHRRLGDLVGTPLLLGPQIRIMVNRAGERVQIVRFGEDFRAQAEDVPPDDAEDVQGWIRTAERAWRLTGYIWVFEDAATQRGAGGGAGRA